EDMAKKMAINQLLLALIGQARFPQAMELVAKVRPLPSEMADVAKIFNYAMSEWGHTGNAPVDMFRRVIELAGTREIRDANFHQCFSLAHFATGDVPSARLELESARQEIRKNPKHYFSCWRYLEVGPKEFASDLDAMDRMFNDASEKPEVF